MGLVRISFIHSVRESQSPVTVTSSALQVPESSPAHTCSQSPSLEFRSPAPAVSNQFTILKQAPSSYSPSGLPFINPNCTWLTCDTNLFILTFQFPADSPVFIPCCSPLISDSSAPVNLQGNRLSVFCKTFPGLNSVSFTHLPLLSTISHLP